MVLAVEKMADRKGRRSEDKTETGKSSLAKADSLFSFAMVAGVLGLGIALLEQEAAAAGADSALNFSLDDGELSDFSLTASQTVFGAGQPAFDEPDVSVAEASEHQNAGSAEVPMGVEQDVAMAAMPSHASFTAGASEFSSGGNQSEFPVTTLGRLVDDPEIDSIDLGEMLDAIGGTDHGFLGGSDGLNIIPDVADGVAEVVDDLPSEGDITGDDGSEPVPTGEEASEAVDDLTGALLGEDGLVDALLGEEGLVDDVVDTLLGEGGLVDDVVDALLGEEGLVDDVVGALLGEEDGLVPTVVDGVVGVASGLTDTLLDGDDGLVPAVLEVPLDLVGSLTETLLGDGEDSGLGTTVLGAPLEVVDSLTGTLLGDGENPGLVGGTLDTVSDLTGGLLGGQGDDDPGPVEGALGTVGNLASGLLGAADGLTETAAAEADFSNTEPTTVDETAADITKVVDDAADSVGTMLDSFLGSDETLDQAAAQTSAAYSSEGGATEAAPAEMAAGAEPASMTAFYEEAPNIFDAAANAVLQITENVATSITPTIPFIGQSTIDSDHPGDPSDPNGTLHHEAVL